LVNPGLNVRSCGNVILLIPQTIAPNAKLLNDDDDDDDN
jgi:hypothetical protein